MTTGSSMQAITLAAPPQAWQVVMSMSPNAPTFGEYPLEPSPQGAYFWCAHVMAAWRSVGVRSIGSSDVLGFRPFPRPAGVMAARCWLLGANTPWKRVRLTRGLGTRAARRAMKSSGSKMTCRDALMPRAQDAQERSHGWCHHARGS